jgi:hypothetical protein
MCILIGLGSWAWDACIRQASCGGDGLSARLFFTYEYKFYYFSWVLWSSDSIQVQYPPSLNFYTQAIASKSQGQVEVEVDDGHPPWPTILPHRDDGSLNPSENINPACNRMASWPFFTPPRSSSGAQQN